MHVKAVTELALMCQERGIMLHVETSGTIEALVGGWLTVSPKQGFKPFMIDFADEVKLLVDETFDLGKVPECILRHRNVFIQPVNAELTIDLDNVQRCIDLKRKMPEWQLSVQLHKVFGWR